jgi:hypothetical protein
MLRQIPGVCVKEAMRGNNRKRDGCEGAQNGGEPVRADAWRVQQHESSRNFSREDQHLSTSATMVTTRVAARSGVLKLQRMGGGDEE